MMIFLREMKLEDIPYIRHIDRSEMIERTYRMNNGQLEEVPAGHECPNWDDVHMDDMANRYTKEIQAGGVAYGAFEGDSLVGFGVLGHIFRGKDLDQLQVDLMYVSRAYRRQGIGSRIMNELSREARSRGARYLYISSTETESAVRFYQSHGGNLAGEVDEELFQLEPEDIHMLKKL